MRKIKFGNVLLCDFVSQSAGNKHTLVNTYTGDIIASSVPARLFFGIYVEVDMQADQPREMKIIVKLGKKKVAEIEAEFPGEIKHERAVLAIPHIPIKVDEEATLKFDFSCEGFRTTTAISKRISVGPIPGSNA